MMSDGAVLYLLASNGRQRGRGSNGNRNGFHLLAVRWPCANSFLLLAAPLARQQVASIGLSAPSAPMRSSQLMLSPFGCRQRMAAAEMGPLAAPSTREPANQRRRPPCASLAQRAADSPLPAAARATNLSAGRLMRRSTGQPRRRGGEKRGEILLKRRAPLLCPANKRIISPKCRSLSSPLSLVRARARAPSKVTTGSGARRPSDLAGAQIRARKWSPARG